MFLTILDMINPNKVRNSVKDRMTYFDISSPLTQPTITCSKLTTETVEQGVKCVQN